MGRKGGPGWRRRDTGTEVRGAGWQVESSRRLDAAGGGLWCTNEGGGGTAAGTGDPRRCRRPGENERKRQRGSWAPLVARPRRPPRDCFPGAGIACQAPLTHYPSGPATLPFTAWRSIGPLCVLPLLFFSRSRSLYSGHHALSSATMHTAAPPAQSTSPRLLRPLGLFAQGTPWMVTPSPRWIYAALSCSRVVHTPRLLKCN